jgi:hypothetical protein
MACITCTTDTVPPSLLAHAKGQVPSPVSNKTSGELARKPIGVFVLDDPEIVRTGVRDMLEARPGIWVIGEAGSTPAAAAKIPAPRPDVAVPGVGVPDDDAVLHAGGNKGPNCIQVSHDELQGNG